MWGDWKRYDEEWIILGAEFDRTIKSFTCMEEIWENLARRADNAAGDDCQPNGEHGAENHYLNRIAIHRGRQAYAKQRAASYRGMKIDAIEKRRLAGRYDVKDPGRMWDGWKNYGKVTSRDIRCNSTEESRKSRRR